MEKSKLSRVLTLILLMALLLLLGGSEALAKKTFSEIQISRRAVGHLFEIGEVRAGSFETPPYIPAKIKFELSKRLRLRGLLSDPSKRGLRLTVSVETRAEFAGFMTSSICSECYGLLISHVQVNDVAKNEIIGKATIRSFNGGGIIIDISDFTEMTHANEIADFLETVVR